MASLDRITEVVHVMPNDNTHACHPLCPCGPLLHYMDERSEVWGHHANNARILEPIEVAS